MVGGRHTELVGRVYNAPGGDCIGFNIVSYTNKKIVLTFGSGYDNAGLGSFSDGDLFVLSIKGEPSQGSSVPAGF